MSNKFKLAVLATGGMDSTLLIYEAVAKGQRPTVITIDYGQLARAEEHRCLNKHIEILGLDPLVILPFSFTQGVKEGLFTEGYKLEKSIEPDDKATYAEGEMKYSEMFIQARNAFLVMTAMAYCAEHKIDELQTGFVNNQGTWDKQRSAYHLWTNDSSPHFVDAINTLCLTGLSHYVRLRAPFLDNRLDKADIYEKCRRRGIDVRNDTYSCYFFPQCGECLSCKTKAALLLASDAEMLDL